MVLLYTGRARRFEPETVQGVNLVHYSTEVTDGLYSPSNLHVYIDHGMRYTTAQGTLILWYSAHTYLTTGLNCMVVL